MIKKVFALSLLVLAIQTAFAADVPDDAAMKLSTALHLKEHIDAMKAKVQVSNEKQIEQILSQVEKSLPGMGEAERSALRASATKFVTAVSSSWNAEQAASIYTTALTKALPPEFADKAAQFYATPEGQRTLAAVSEAEQQLTNYITSSQEQATAVAYATFMDEMKSMMTAKAKTAAPQAKK